MRKLALVAALVLATVSGAADGINIGPTPIVFTDCAAGGSVAQTVVARIYLLTVTDKDIFLCFAAAASTCATGGMKFPMGTVITLSLNSQQLSVSCRSSDSTGDVSLVPAG